MSFVIEWSTKSAEVQRAVNVGDTFTASGTTFMIVSVAANVVGDSRPNGVYALNLSTGEVVRWTTKSVNYTGEVRTGRVWKYVIDGD